MPNELTAAVESQVTAKQESSSPTSTLVISVSCSHKNAAVLAPFVLQIDGAIKLWNNVFKNNQIDIKSPTAMLMKSLKGSVELDQDKLTLFLGQHSDRVLLVCSM